MENGWGKHEKLVLSELNRLSGGIESLSAKLDDCRMEILQTKTKLETTHKLKSSAWGFLGGAIPMIVSIVTYLLKT